MSAWRLLPASALASLVLLAVSARASDLSGVVRGPDGMPVAGALVAAVAAGASPSDVPPTRRSDSAGAFRFTGLPAGRYGLTATARGFEGAFRGGIETREGATPPDAVLALAPVRWTLYVSATDLRGAPIRGARAVAARVPRERGEVWVAEPEPDGHFALRPPDASQLDVYLVSVVAEGYQTESRYASVDQSLFLRLATAAEATTPAPAAVVAGIRASAIPLVSVEAGHGFADLQPLKQVVGDARIVALGEATHGTREFFQLKHRILEFLVSEMGFTVFAIEANWPEALAVDDYVVNGSGDPAQALAGLYFWTWNTEEVLDLVRWMRRWNEDASHARKVRFAGVDMQYPAVSAAAVRNHLTASKAWSPAWDEGFGLLTRPDIHTAWATLTEVQRSALSRTISEIGAALDARRASLPPGAPLDAWETARQHARILAQFERMMRGSSNGTRDRAMAENAVWVLEHAGPGARMVLWAHNGHISRDPTPGDRAMGASLMERYGGDYRSFGFAFDSGSFRAGAMGDGLRTFTAAPAPPASLDAALAATGLPVFALDLRALPAGTPAGDWIRLPRKTRSFGALYDDSSPDAFFFRAVAPDHYDALLFVAKTTASRPSPPASTPEVIVPRAAPAARNLDFEEGPVAGAPAAWFVPRASLEDGWSAAVTEERPAKGRYAAVIARTREGAARFAGILMQHIDAAPWRGKKVRLKASVRVEPGADGGQAGLFLRVDRAGGVIGFFDNMGDRPIRDPDWRTHEIVGEVAADATTIMFAFWLERGGRAFVDDVSLSEAPSK